MGRKHQWAPVSVALPEMVRRIVDRFDPDRIYLFGSQVTGDATEDSDIDLLVVMPVEGSERDAAVAIRGLLGDIDIPLDVIVNTPEEFAWRKDCRGTIAGVAFRQGRSMYARQPGPSPRHQGMGAEG
jgi:predicted nucleotidyltransferase